MKCTTDSPFPCGKCLSCRINRASDWATRCCHELLYADCSLFVTLTYAPDCLPDQGTLVPAHLSAFIKRLRFNLKGRRIKFLGVGEYGEKFLRPHYHLILFGIGGSLDDLLSLEKSWPYGYVHVGNVTYHSARYVAGYCFSKMDWQLSGKAVSHLVQPFMRCSQGFGKRYALDNSSSIKSLQKVNNGKGTLVPAPRYYRKVLSISYDPKAALVDYNKEFLNVVSTTVGLQVSYKDAVDAYKAYHKALKNFNSVSNVKKKLLFSRRKL